MFLFHSSNPFARLEHKLGLVVRGRLWLQALFGLGLGLLVGMLMGPDVGLVSPGKAKVITGWLALPGELFLRLIAMILIPLLIASIVRGLGGSTNIKTLRTVGVRFFLYIICTTTIATTIGLTIARVIEPGSYVDMGQSVGVSRMHSGFNGVVDKKGGLALAENMPSSIVNLIPDNPLRSAINGEMLGVVIFSIIIGIAFAVRQNRKIAPLLGLLDGILDVCMTIVKWALLLVPFAVFGLIARMASRVGFATLAGVAVYVFAVLAGLAALLVFYCLVVLIFGKFNPFLFMRKVLPVQLLAFATSSSAAVIPVSIQTAEAKLNVERESAEVIIPLGATMNMDGTALYQSVALLFLAQVAGVDLTLSQTVLVILTLVFSSIGAPATPGVGMVILGSVAANIGIPTTGLALIFGVDRVVDMCRTAVNVTGDLAACVVLGREKKPRTRKN